MTYQQLLRTPEWRNKTIEILTRDNYTCKRCGTNNSKPLKPVCPEPFIELLSKSTFISENNSSDNRNIRFKLNDTHNGFLCKSPNSIEELSDGENLILLFQTVWKESISYPFIATLGNVRFDDSVHRKIEQDPVYQLLRCFIKKDLPIDVDLEGVYVMEKGDYNGSIHYKDSHVLEVHHKCYRKGIEIWEHPNEEYVTLCNVCHDIVHENQEIPFYDVAGRELQNLAKCDRCTGKGYLAEYRHVQNGVCFKCNGRGKLLKQ